MTGPVSPLPEWIAVDWGTSRLRVWMVGGDGKVVAKASSGRGMSKLEPGQFEPALKALICDLMPPDRQIPIIACGMVGSRQGWAEAGYVVAPCAPPGITHAVQPENTALSVYILAGIKQLDPADLMRGEETQIAGYLRKRPDFDGVICLPGTHTKWVHVQAGEVVGFQTYLTGELYALLSQKSVLRHAMVTSDWDDGAFSIAIEEAIARPAGFGAQLFRLRAESLINAMPPQTARARLSGLLIGLELAAARSDWQGRTITIIGASDLARLYGVALQAQGVSPRIENSQDMALAGLTAAYETLTEMQT